MGFIDNLKKAARSDYDNGVDDYDEYDDEIFEDELDDEPERRRGFHRKNSAPVTEPTRPQASASVGAASPIGSVDSARVVNINHGVQYQVVVIEPKTYDEAEEIATHLLDRKSVVLNLAKTEDNVARRLADYLNGCNFVLGGNVTKIAFRTFLFSPKNVDVSGEYSGGADPSNKYYY